VVPVAQTTSHHFAHCITVLTLSAVATARIQTLIRYSVKQSDYDCRRAYGLRQVQDQQARASSSAKQVDLAYRSTLLSSELQSGSPVYMPNWISERVKGSPRPYACVCALASVTLVGLLRFIRRQKPHIQNVLASFPVRRNHVFLCISGSSRPDYLTPFFPSYYGVARVLLHCLIDYRRNYSVQQRMQDATNTTACLCEMNTIIWCLAFWRALMHPLAKFRTDLGQIWQR
jgi:hypothetical protein